MPANVRKDERAANPVKPPAEDSGDHSDVLLVLVLLPFHEEGQPTFRYPIGGALLTWFVGSA